MTATLIGASSLGVAAVWRQRSSAHYALAVYYLLISDVLDLDDLPERPAAARLAVLSREGGRWAAPPMLSTHMRRGCQRRPACESSTSTWRSPMAPTVAATAVGRGFPAAEEGVEAKARVAVVAVARPAAAEVPIGRRRRRQSGWWWKWRGRYWSEQKENGIPC